MRLFDYSDEMIALEKALESVDATPEELDAALSAWLEDNGDDLRAKLDDYCALIREYEARSKARKEEADRVRAHATTDAKNADRLQERLLYFLQLHGIEKMETPRYKLTVARNGGIAPLKIEVDAADLPEAYQTRQIVANVQAIREALMVGIEVPGARLGERGIGLRIR